MKEIDNPGPQSVSDVIAWLRKSPRTSGWDCLMIFDREQANELLMQAYISNLGSATFVDPITDVVTIVPNERWEHLYDYTLDTPRLTFNQGSIRQASATLTMRVMGGSQLAVRQRPMGPKFVSSVSWIDPLQGPTLTAELDLSSADITVDAAHRARMKIAAAREFTLTFDDSADARAIGGEFFEILFRALPDDKKFFMLNLLGPPRFGGSYQPTRATLRMFQGSNGRYALMCFVRSEDSGDVTIPFDETGWVYPLPPGYFSLMLLGNHFLTRKLILDCIDDAAPSTEVQYEIHSNPNADPGAVIVVAGGTRRLTYNIEAGGVFSTFKLEHGFPMASGAGGITATFQVSCRNLELNYTWSGTTTNGNHIKATTTAPTRSCNWSVGWRAEQTYELRCTDDDVRMVRTDAAVTLDANTIPPVDSFYTPHLPFMYASIGLHLNDFFRQGASHVPSPTSQIDVLRLHSLLFRVQHLISLEEVSHNMDLALFGKLHPHRTLFDIVPADLTLGPSSSRHFTIYPSLPSGQQPFWSVSGIPGFAGDRGSITNKGLYTSPSTEEIAGPYTIVRVQASKDNAYSSALVRVVKRDVVVNPLVFVTSLNDGPTKMSAGTLDRGALAWTIQSQTGATIKPIDIQLHPQFEQGDYFYVPGQSPSGKAWSVDEVTVTNPRTKQSHTGHVVVLEKETAWSIKIVENSGLPGNQVQLKYGGDEITAPATWELLAGSGSLSSSGIYTFDKHSAHKFAVIGASLSIAGFLMTNVMVLPIPLVELDEVARILR